MFNVDWVSSFRSAVSTQRFVDAFKKRAHKTIPRARRDPRSESFAYYAAIHIHLKSLRFPREPRQR
jgi:hypothetical protein